MKLRTNNALFWCGSELRFLRMKEIMSDPNIWPQTYADFVRKTDELIETTKKKGIILTKVDADPDVFLDWCKVKACSPDRRARQFYAVEKFSDERDAAIHAN